MTAACALECVALLVFAIGGYLTRTSPDGRTVYPLIAVSALAMGLQSVAVRSLGVAGVATTYITGTWTSLVAGLATRLRKARLSGTPSAHTPQPRGVGIQAAVVVANGLAAVGGGAAETIWHLAAIVVRRVGTLPADAGAAAAARSAAPQAGQKAASGGLPRLSRRSSVHLQPTRRP